MSHLQKAINFAHQYHHNQFRKTGEPYVHHCLAVMNRVKDLGLDETYQVVAVLHDILEKGEKVSREMVQRQFGEEVTRMIEALSKDHVDEYKKHTYGYDLRMRTYIKRLEEGALTHPELLIIKMCDQLDNLETAYVFEEQKYYQFIFSIKTYFLPLYCNYIRHTTEELRQTHQFVLNELVSIINILLESTHRENRKHLEKENKDIFPS